MKNKEREVIKPIPGGYMETVTATSIQVPSASITFAATAPNHYTAT
jgi:hypothetical protein